MATKVRLLANTVICKRSSMIELDQRVILAMRQLKSFFIVEQRYSITAFFAPGQRPKTDLLTERVVTGVMLECD